jgi:endonuclease YncB( thermonuclease family)
VGSIEGQTFSKDIVYDSMDKQAAFELLSNYDNSTPMFSLAGYEGWARLCDLHDGDSLKLTFPFNDGKVHRVIGRVLSVNSPEMISKDPVVKAWAFKARNRLLSLIAPEPFEVNGTYSKKDIIKKLHEDVSLLWIKAHKQDKYGRILLDIYFSPEDTKTIQSILIEEGYCKPYDGGTKQQWVPDDCKLRIVT